MHSCTADTDLSAACLCACLFADSRPAPCATTSLLLPRHQRSMLWTWDSSMSAFITQVAMAGRLLLTREETVNNVTVRRQPPSRAQLLLMLGCAVHVLPRIRVWC